MTITFTEQEHKTHINISLDLIKGEVITLDTSDFVDDYIMNNVYNRSSDFIPLIRGTIKNYISENIFEQ